MIRPFSDPGRAPLAELNEVFSPFGSRYPKQGLRVGRSSIYEPLGLNASERVASRLVAGDPDIAATCRLR